jgi:chromate transporter
LPVVSAGLFLGKDNVAFQQGLFFSKVAVVTFGGAYAVLPYVAQQAVEHHHWLSAGEMMDGLGLAETTPGPLILVLQFVGFLGGWHHASAELSPLMTAAICSFLTTWVIFLPSFLFIFLGAPYIERWRGNEWLASALSTITAAVVGVMLNLAVWFSWHTLFPRPDAAQWFGVVDWFALVLAVIAFVGIWRWKWDVIPVVLGSGALGLAYHFASLYFARGQ